MAEKPKRTNDSWFHRRILVYSTTAFCMASLVWLMWNGTDSQLHLLIAEGCFWVIVAILICYVFAALAEDVFVLLRNVPGPLGAVAGSIVPAQSSPPSYRPQNTMDPGPP